MLIFLLLIIFVLYVVKAFAWGLAFYAGFIFFWKKDSDWQIGAIVSGTIFTFWNEFKETIGIYFIDDGRIEVTSADLVNSTLLNIIIYFGLGYGGFVAGRWVFKKVVQNLKD